MTSNRQDGQVQDDSGPTSAKQQEQSEAQQSAMKQEQQARSEAQESSLVAWGRWYGQQLQVRPLVTKSSTAFILHCASSAVAQGLQKRFSLREIISFSLQAMPPFTHYWFEFLES
ncbi:unnamed protein product, partial [Polarella glacialis]